MRKINYLAIILIAVFLCYMIVAGERSAQWEKVREAHIVLEPDCQWCGEKDRKELNVHHIIEFSENPKYELLDSPDGKKGNLITLCEKCHFVVGHRCNYKISNPFVREECNEHQKNISVFLEYKKAALEAKFNKLLEDGK